MKRCALVCGCGFGDVFGFRFTEHLRRIHNVKISIREATERHFWRKIPEFRQIRACNSRKYGKCEWRTPFEALLTRRHACKADAKVTPYPEPDEFLQYLPKALRPKFGYPTPQELDAEANQSGDSGWTTPRRERKRENRSLSRQRQAQHRGRSQSRPPQARAASQQQKRQREESQPRTGGNQGAQAKNRRSVSRNPQQSRDYDDDYADFSGQNPQYKRARQDGQQSTQSRRARQRTRRRNQPQEPIVRQPRSSGGPSLNRSAHPQDFGPRQNPQPRMTGHRHDRHYEARSEGELSGSDEETQVMQPYSGASKGILKHQAQSSQSTQATQAKPQFPPSNEVPRVDELTSKLATTSLAKSPRTGDDMSEKQVEEAMLVPLPNEPQNVDMSEAEKLLESPVKPAEGENRESSGSKKPEQTSSQQASQQSSAQSYSFGATDVRLQTGELIRLSDGSTVENPHWVPPQQPIVRPKDPKRHQQRGRSQSRVHFDVSDPTPAESAAVREEFVVDWELLKSVQLPRVPELKAPYAQYVDLFLQNPDFPVDCMGDLRFSEKLKEYKAMKMRFFMPETPMPGLYLLVNSKSKACAYVVVTLSCGHPDQHRFSAIASQFNPNDWCVVSEALQLKETGMQQTRFFSFSYPPLVGDYWLVSTPVKESNQLMRIVFRKLPRSFGSAHTIRYKPTDE